MVLIWEKPLSKLHHPVYLETGKSQPLRRAAAPDNQTRAICIERTITTGHLAMDELGRVRTAKNHLTLPISSPYI